MIQFLLDYFYVPMMVFVIYVIVMALKIVNTHIE
jgi:hypothetical protein